MSVAPPLKQCAVCGTDVSGRKRTKDPEGNYYCEPCWGAKVAERRHRPPPTGDDAVREESLDDLLELATSASVGPSDTPAAAPLLSCSACGGAFTYAHVTTVNGRTVCTDCIAGPAPSRQSWPLPFLGGSRRRRRAAEETPKERYRRLGSWFRVGGVVLQLAPVLWLVMGIWGIVPDPETSSAGQLVLVLAVALCVLGVVLMFVGFALYAMEKGRSPAWCAAGFLGFLGIIILWGLADHNAAPRRAPTRYGY